MLHGISFVARLIGKAAFRVVAATFLAFFVLENSIAGGLRGILIAPGSDPDSPRNREIIERFHLDGNVVQRYVRWLSDALQGDFGRSTRGDVPVTEVLLHRLPISLELMLVGTLLALLIGIPAGLAAAVWADRKRGTVLSAGLGILQSIPLYISPVFLIWIFALELQWLPAAGWVRISESFWGNLEGLILPVTALALSEVALVARTIRSDVYRVLSEDFIAAARSKGLSRPYILLRHAFRPGALGMLNVLGMNVGNLLSGALLIEIIFGIGGLGRELFESSINRDLPVLLGLVTYGVLVYGAVNAVVDIAMYGADPRTRRK